MNRASDRRNDQGAIRGHPRQARPGRLAAFAEHGSGQHAPSELLAVAPRDGVDLRLQLGAVHQLRYLEAEHERLNQHHDRERHENVGRDQATR